MQDILTGCDGWTAAGAVRCGGKSQLRGVFWLAVFAWLLSICEWVGVRAEDVKSTWSGGSVKTSYQLKVR